MEDSTTAAFPSYQLDIFPVQQFDVGFLPWVLVAAEDDAWTVSVDEEDVGAVIGVGQQAIYGLIRELPVSGTNLPRPG